MKDSQGTLNYGFEAEFLTRGEEAAAKGRNGGIRYCKPINPAAVGQLGGSRCASGIPSQSYKSISRSGREKWPCFPVNEKCRPYGEEAKGKKVLNHFYFP